MATKALADLARTLADTLEQFDQVERQVRNARMTDALELSPAELAAAYPEAVNEAGLLRSDPDPDTGYPEPSDDPYEFWALTQDAALLARLGGALKLAADLVRRALEAQPPAE